MTCCSISKPAYGKRSAVNEQKSFSKSDFMYKEEKLNTRTEVKIIKYYVKVIGKNMSLVVKR